MNNSNIEKDKRSKVFLGIIIAALLILNGILGYNLWKENKLKKAQKTELVGKDTQIKTLEVQQAEAKVEMDEMQSNIDELTEDKAVLKKELQRKLNIIRASSKNKKLNLVEIGKLKKELSELKIYYDEKIAELEEKNKNLTEENISVKNDLANEKSVTEKQAQMITAKNKTISLAKRITASSVKAVALKKQHIGGKIVETTRSARVEAFKISFSLNKNQVADRGDKDIFIRIINPEGTTIAIESLGSGTFQTENSTALYTLKKVIDFDGSAQSSSVIWKQGNPYKSGKYTVIVYSDGLPIGTSDVILR